MSPSLGTVLRRLVEAWQRVTLRVPDAELEVARWTPEDIAEYRRTHGGEAPPDAPHIDDEGI